MNGIYYVTTGPVRGDCGHQHKTPHAAWLCLCRDGDGCREQGGHSDREVLACEGGRLRQLTEAEWNAIDEGEADALFARLRRRYAGKMEGQP